MKGEEIFEHEFGHTGVAWTDWFWSCTGTYGPSCSGGMILGDCCGFGCILVSGTGVRRSQFLVGMDKPASFRASVLEQRICGVVPHDGQVCTTLRCQGGVTTFDGGESQIMGAI